MGPPAGLAEQDGDGGDGEGAHDEGVEQDPRATMSPRAKVNVTGSVISTANVPARMMPALVPAGTSLGRRAWSGTWATVASWPLGKICTAG